MWTTTRITRTSIIVGCILVVFVGAAFFIRIVTRSSSATIRSRNSLRALLSMPKDLRQFPVEKYIESGDSLVYHMSNRRDGLRHWRLQIETAAGDVHDWKDAFHNYLKPRGTCTEYVRRRTSQPEFFLRWSDNAGAHGWVTFTGPQAAGRLSITFEYYEFGLVHKLLSTKLGRFLGLILAKIGYPLDAMTLPT